MYTRFVVFLGIVLGVVFVVTALAWMVFSQTSATNSPKSSNGVTASPSKGVTSPAAAAGSSLQSTAATSTPLSSSSPAKVRKGDILVAGKNFGCGSSREHAPVAIKASGVSCVIAKSFARIFFRNSFNTGLLIFESPPAWEGINEGDIVEVNPDQGIILNRTSNQIFKVAPLPPFMKELLQNGGLIAHIKKRRELNEESPQ